MNLSVIICTHNPRLEYLSRVLQALRAQTLPKSEWELLLIDNASRSPLAASVSLAWHPNTRHIREEVLGLTSARLRGIREAKGELLVFVDDDSVLDSTYLKIALGIDKSRPDLGCWGAGRIEPEYEKSAPEWLSAYDGVLAVRRLDRDLWANIPALNQSLPYGVGMCVRRTVAAQYADLCQGDNVRRSLGRSGESLVSCEDTDIAILACEFGMATASFTTLKITHLIPERRTTLQYISRLIAGNAESEVVLLFLHGLDNDNLSLKRLRTLKLKYLFLWIRYLTSGFSVHFRLALWKLKGQLNGYKRLQDLGLLQEHTLRRGPWLAKKSSELPSTNHMLREATDLLRATNTSNERP
jgi:glycosyltransferase involved in cell wall biosynthesis